MNDNLITENIKLVNYVIKKMGFFYNKDDYYEIGIIALINASKTFDEKKHCEFSTYAITCIKNEILKYIRLEKCDKRKANYNVVSLENGVKNSKNDLNVSLLEVLKTEENIEERILKREKIRLLKTIISILEPRDKFMLEHYFELWGNEKMTQIEIAKHLGVNQRFVCYRIKRAMRIIKKIMEDKYGE